MGELQDVCGALGLWCHLVWCREEWQGAEDKINVLFLTMCGTAGMDETVWDSTERFAPINSWMYITIENTCVTSGSLSYLLNSLLLLIIRIFLSLHKTRVLMSREPVQANSYMYCFILQSIWGTQWRRRLKHCVTRRKVAGSIPVGFGIFHWHTSGRNMALESTQPLTEMSTRNISWCLMAGA